MNSLWFSSSPWVSRRQPCPILLPGRNQGPVCPPSIPSLAPFSAVRNFLQEIIKILRIIIATICREFTVTQGLFQIIFMCYLTSSPPQSLMVGTIISILQMKILKLWKLKLLARGPSHWKAEPGLNTGISNPKTSVRINGSQSAVPKPTTSSSPGNLL